MRKEAVAVWDSQKWRWFLLIGITPWLGGIFLVASEVVRSQSSLTAQGGLSGSDPKKSARESANLDHPGLSAKILRVTSERQIWTLPVSSDRDGWLIAVGVTARTPGKYPIRLNSRASQQQLPKGITESLADFRSHLGNQSLKVEKTPRVSKSSSEVPVGLDRKRLELRTFAIQTQAGDSHDLAFYELIEAKLAKIGRNVLVYVDQRDTEIVSDSTLAQVVEIVDEEIPAHVIPRIGRATDTDSDHRMTVVLSQALGRIGDGLVVLDGFVRPSDFEKGGTFPRSHSTDMIYLNSRVSAGPFLKSLLAHEYTHAVVASNRILNESRNTEESWLDEGLAHLAERWVDGSWENLDYRISAFLHASHDYRLVVDDQNGLGDSRVHGHRGASYLFLSWCESIFGRDFARRLIESPEIGLKNLEYATGKSFDELFRGWSVHLLERSACLEGSKQVQSQALLSESLVGIPQATLQEVSFDEESLGVQATTSWQAQGTSVRLFRLIPEKGGLKKPVAIEIELLAPLDAGVQITAVPFVDRHHGFRLDLLGESEVRNKDSVKTIQLALTNLDQDRPLNLQAAAWEMVANPNDARMGKQNRGFFDLLMIAKLMGGTITLRPGERRITGPIVTQFHSGEGSRMVWNVVAHDPQGRPVFASTEAGTVSRDRKIMPPRLAGDWAEDGRKLLR